jgi:hypothetical protein
MQGFAKCNIFLFVTFSAILCCSRRPSSRCRTRLKCDGTRAETRFCLSAKRTSPFKSARASVQSTTGSRAARISGSNAGYTMFRGSVKGTGYPLHSPVFPLLSLSYVIVFHHVSTALYLVSPAVCRSIKFTYLLHGA